MMRSGAISEEAGVVGVTVVYLFLAVLLVGMFVFSIWVAFREDGATKRK